LLKYKVGNGDGQGGTCLLIDLLASNARHAFPTQVLS